MKKLLILTVAIALSACACFDASDAQEAETETTAAVQTAEQDASVRQVVVAKQPAENVRVVRRRVRVYDGGYAAPRRVRRVYYRDSAPASAYREDAPTYRSRRVSESSYNEYDECGDSACPAKVRVTREPVEVIYRKTKYTTVYQPKTYKDVSYVREPYAADYDDTAILSASSEIEEDDECLK